MAPRELKRNRMIRVTDTLWNKALNKAEAGSEPHRITVQLNGDETVSEAIRKFLEAWTRR